MQVDNTGVADQNHPLVQTTSCDVEPIMRSDMTTQFPDPNTTSQKLVDVMNESALASDIATQMVQSDSIVASLPNTVLNGPDIIASDSSIIITNDAIVFPEGTLMLSNENQSEEITEENDVITEDMDEDSANDTSEFDIKVESVENATLKSITPSFKVDNHPQANTNSTFTINRHVLQNISDPVGDLQEITFNNGDHITQFHIQLPLSMTDLQNLQKINRNVFMSQAALPDDTKGLGEENIIVDHNGENMMVNNNIVGHGSESIIVGGNNEENIIVNGESKHDFLTRTQSIVNDSTVNKMRDAGATGDAKEVITVPDDNKDYIPPDGSFNADQHGNLFIKNENTITPATLIQAEEIVEGRVKCEAAIANSTDNQLVTNLPYQQIMYVQVDSNEPGGEPQIFPITVSESVSSSLEIAVKPTANVTKTGEKRKKCGRPRTKKVASAQQMEKSNLRTLAPRLLSIPLYAGAQAGIGVGKSLLKPVNLGAMQIIEGGQYFEVLGRCTQCFRFSRTTTYCRAEKNHREPKSAVCMECEAVGLSTVVCRRKLNHSAPNAQPLNIVINTALQNTEHVKQLCIRNNLPPCFCELQSIVVHHADITFVGQRKYNSKGEMKSEMKYDIQDFGNPDMLSAPDLTRNEDGGYSNVISSSQVNGTSDGREFTASGMITAEELAMTASQLNQKTNQQFLNSALATSQMCRKEDLKSELKYDEQDFAYSDFVSIPRVTRKATDYARGYLYPYSKERWAQWLLKFCYQTSTNFRIRTGKRVNKKLDHGLANHNGRIVPYRTLETQLYNCALGGRPRKRKARDGIKKRKERGSKLIGCPAVIHTRLLETEYNWCALEVTIPKILAHLPFHDPRENPDVLVEYDDIMLAENNPNQQLHPAEGEVDDEEQKFDFIHELADHNENLNGKKDLAPLDVKKSTKNLLLTCANLTEMIDNTTFMQSIQEQSRDMLNRMHKEAMSTKQSTAAKKVKRKKFLTEQGEQEVGGECAVTDKQQILSAENLQQIEHIGMVNMIN